MKLAKRQRQDQWWPLSRMRDELNRMFSSPEFGETDFFEGGWLPPVIRFA